MARSRNIKPGFFINDELGELDPVARLLFIGMWTIADREGRMEDRPRKIKAACLPYDQVDVDSILDQLHQAGFIVRYEIQGDRYIQIINWHKHQQPHHKEKPSEIPEFKGQNKKPRISPGQTPDKPGTCPEEAALIPDSLNLIPDSCNTPPTPPQGGASAPPPPVAEKKTEPDQQQEDTKGKSNQQKPAGEVQPAQVRARGAPAWWDQEAWDEWARWRRVEKRKKISPTAAAAQYRRLAEWAEQGMSMRAIIEQSIERDWQGLFELKTENRGGTRAGPYPKKHPSGYTAPPEPEDTRNAEEMAADILEAVQYLRGHEDFEYSMANGGIPGHFMGAVNRLAREIESYESKFGGDPLPRDSRQWIETVFEKLDAEHT